MHVGSSVAGWGEHAAPTRRRRLAGAVAVVAALSPLPAATAAAAPRVLVLDAARDATVDVTFTGFVTIDLPHAAVSGGHRYAGFYFQPLAGNPSDGAGAVFVRAYAASGFTDQPIPLGTGSRELADKPVLAPGAYRIHVLGDTAVRVSVPVSGHPGGRLRATRPAKVSFASSDVTPYPAGVAAPGGAVASLPVDVVSGRAISFATVQLLHHGSTAASRFTTQECIGSSDRPMCAAEAANAGQEQYHQSEYNLALPAMTFTGNDEWARFYYPDFVGLSAGPHTAHYAVATTSLVDRTIVAALSFAV